MVGGLALELAGLRERVRRLEAVAEAAVAALEEAPDWRGRLRRALRLLTPDADI
jgi:hypothetical protein